MRANATTRISPLLVLWCARRGLIFLDSVESSSVETVCGIRRAIKLAPRLQGETPESETGSRRGVKGGSAPENSLLANIHMDTMRNLFE
jgi:hypothetical protein